MRNLLALAAAALIAFVVVGWFLGWYQVSSTPNEAGREFNVEINSPKISKDLAAGKEKLREALEKENTPAPQTQPPAPTNTGVPVSYQTPDAHSFVYPSSGPSAGATPPSPATGSQPRPVPPPLDAQEEGPIVLPPPSK